MRTAITLGAGLGLWMAAMASLADEGAADYRHHSMEAVGGHMMAMVDIIRRKVPHQQHMGLHANAMADLASITDSLFPEGSEGGDALPAIWKNPEDFADKVQAFKGAAAGLKDAVQSAGDIGAAFQTLGGACKGCHDDYRAE